MVYCILISTRMQTFADKPQNIFQKLVFEIRRIALILTEFKFIKNCEHDCIEVYLFLSLGMRRFSNNSAMCKLKRNDKNPISSPFTPRVIFLIWNRLPAGIFFVQCGSPMHNAGPNLILTQTIHIAVQKQITAWAN